MKKYFKYLVSIGLVFILSTPVFAYDYTMSFMYGGTTYQYKNYVEKTNKLVNCVSPDFFEITPDGNLKSNKISRELVLSMHEKNIQIIPFISNFWDRELGAKALSNKEILSDNISQMVNNYNLDGISIDFNNLTEIHKSTYFEFIEMLKTKMPNKIISVSVAPNPQDLKTGWYGSYDYEKLQSVADFLILMCLDESYNNSSPGPVASSEFIEKSITNLLKYTSPEKIVLGIPFYGRYWKIEGNTKFGGHGITNMDIETLLNNYNSTKNYNENNNTVQATLNITKDDIKPKIWGGTTLEEGQYEIWYDDLEASINKISLVDKYSLKGVASWSLGQENTSIWENYKSYIDNENEENSQQEYYPQNEKIEQEQSSNQTNNYIENNSTNIQPKDKTIRSWVTEEHFDENNNKVVKDTITIQTIEENNNNSEKKSDFSNKNSEFYNSKSNIDNANNLNAKENLNQNGYLDNSQMQPNLQSNLNETEKSIETQNSQPDSQSQMNSEIQPNLQTQVNSEMQPNSQAKMNSEMQPNSQTQPNLQTQVIQTEKNTAMQNSQPNSQTQMNSQTQPNLQTQEKNTATQNSQPNSQAKMNSEMQPNLQTQERNTVTQNSQPNSQAKMNSETQPNLQTQVNQNEKNTATQNPQVNSQAKMNSEMQPNLQTQEINTVTQNPQPNSQAKMNSETQPNLQTQVNQNEKNTATQNPQVNSQAKMNSETQPNLQAQVNSEIQPNLQTQVNQTEKNTAMQNSQPNSQAKMNSEMQPNLQAQPNLQTQVNQVEKNTATQNSQPNSQAQVNQNEKNTVTQNPQANSETQPNLQTQEKNTATQNSQPNSQMQPNSQAKMNSYSTDQKNNKNSNSKESPISGPKLSANANMPVLQNEFITQKNKDENIPELSKESISEIETNQEINLANKIFNTGWITKNEYNSNKNVTKAQAIKTIMRMASNLDAPDVQIESFLDTKNHKDNIFITKAKFYGIIESKENMFYPENYITKVEFLCLLDKVFNIPNTVNFHSNLIKDNYKESDAESYYTLNKYFEHGIIKLDENNNFNSNSDLTMDEMLEIIEKLDGKGIKDLKNIFDEENISNKKEFEPR